MSEALSSLCSSNTLRQRVVVVSIFLTLLLRVDCFHAPCHTHSEFRHRALQRGVAAGDQTQDAGQGGVVVPDTLRDSIIEEIEELGGGKVTEVSSIVCVTHVTSQQTACCVYAIISMNSI